MPENKDLSEREVEILKLVATGASNKEIAYRLKISTNTVKVHLRNIFAKIGVASRTEAAMYAVNAGLVPTAVVANQQGGVGLRELEGGSGWSEKLYGIYGWIGIGVVIILALAIIATRLLHLERQAPVEAGAAIEAPRWQRRADMPTARFGMGVAVYDNKFYVIGGEAEEGVTGVVERYDPASDTWVKLNSKPTKVADVGAAVIGGKIYVPGGRLASGAVTDVMEIYDPGKDEWSRGVSLPEAVSAYAMVSFEGKLYVFGGWDGRQYLKTVLEYQPEQGVWNYKSPLSVARAYAGSAVINGKIYLLGGFNGHAPLKLNEIYDPSLDNGLGNAWESSMTMPEGRYGMGISNLMDVIYLVGGQGQRQVDMPIVAYSYRLDQWQLIQSPGYAGSYSLGLATYGTDLYAIGGKINQKPAKSNISIQVIYVVVLPFLR